MRYLLWVGEIQDVWMVRRLENFHRYSTPDVEDVCFASFPERFLGIEANAIVPKYGIHCLSPFVSVFCGLR